MARSQLSRTTEKNAQEISNLIRSAELTLQELEISLRNWDAEDAEIWPLLQRKAYNDPRFREIGLIDPDGNLIATSLGPVRPPIQIDSLGRVDLSNKTLQLTGPLTTTVMRERSIVLVWPTEGQGELNILVDPMLLQDFWTNLNELDLGQDGYLAYVDTSNDKVIAGIGLFPKSIDPFSSTIRRDRIRVIQPVADTEMVVIGEVSRHWVMQNWHRLFTIAMPIVLLVSFLIISLLARLLWCSQLWDYDIEVGLKNREFELYYQPIFNLENNRCVGAEALIRWQYSHQRTVLPSVFIPAAEATGIITRLGQWIIEQVVAQCTELLDERYDFYISINLSPIQITSIKPSKLLFDLLLSQGNVVHKLMFEITETTLADAGEEQLQKNIQKIQGLGAKIALDDFGTGFSGINYLSKLKVDYLKIDRTFTHASATASLLSSVLVGVVDLSNRLGISLIAEGIETEEQRSALLAKGVQFGQGWLYAYPMTFSEFEAFLATQPANSANAGRSSEAADSP
ncbi:MAG: EAL domain-containing protein [Leptolyngbyaceae cyanobacterium]